MALRSKTCTVLEISNTRIMDLNHAWDTDALPSLSVQVMD